MWWVSKPGKCLYQEVTSSSSSYLYLFFYIYLYFSYIIPCRYLTCHLSNLGWAFIAPPKIRSKRLYLIGSTNSSSVLCGACVKQNRCRRCQCIDQEQTTVCGNTDHMYCQQCIQEMPAFFHRERLSSDFITLAGYNANACTSPGGPCCWLCYKPGTRSEYCFPFSML
jgi:hypothetical protein